MQGPNPGGLAVAAVVLATLAIGVWFFLLRGDGAATSEFLAAHERFVAAEQTAEGAMAQVERFLELEEFNATINAQRVVMQHQAAVFEGLSNEEGGGDTRLATEAAAASTFVLNALDGYAAAILDRRLADAASAVVEMQGGVADLDRVAAEWKKLH